MTLENCQEWVTFVKDVVTILAALITAIIAFCGLKTWRKQLKGKTEYELAQRLLRAVYKVRDAIGLVRIPFQSSGEISAAVKEAGTEGDSSAAVYHLRWKYVAEAMSDLGVETLEAEVIWGKLIMEPLNPLRQLVAEMNAKISIYFMMTSKETPSRYSQESWDKVQRVIYMSDDPTKDEFASRLQKAVQKIENMIKPHLKL